MKKTTQILQGLSLGQDRFLKVAGNIRSVCWNQQQEQHWHNICIHYFFQFMSGPVFHNQSGFPILGTISSCPRSLPTQRPDLNSIQHICAELERQLWVRPYRPVAALVNAPAAEWERKKSRAAKYQNLPESSFSKVKPLATAVHGLKWHLCDGNESNTTRFYDFMSCVLQVQLLMMVTLGVLSGDLSLPATKIWSLPGSFFSPAAFEVFLLQTKFTFYLSFKSDIHIFNWCLLPKRIWLRQ